MGIDRDESLLKAAAELRRRAEERLGESWGSAHLIGTEDDSRLLHELQVHQIELEMQNAELRQTRNDVETALEMYTDLYDFAPVGYVTVDREGFIRGVNLTGASLLGIERTRLIGRLFEQFVAGAERPILAALLGKIFTSSTKEACEVELLKAENSPRFIQIEGMIAPSAQECRLAFIDISERKRLQEELSSKINQLETALAKVKLLEGIIPICGYCKKIRDDHEVWHELVEYVTEHSEAIFSHGICPQCLEKELSAPKDLKK
jgi:PAS domain S-box-containing protein